ncbi:MAG: hypothetical protein ABTD50_21770 [Polyangiaceae bacterium]
MGDIHPGGTVHGTGPEPLSDSNSGPDEHLPTTKLPPLPAPPPMVRRSGAPPPYGASSPPLGAQGLDATVPVPSPLGAPGSWWRDMASMVARQAGAASRGADVTMVEKSVGAVCGGFGLALFFLALGVGLRGVPPEVSNQPTVVAASIVARAAMACGMLAFGFGLLRICERLLSGRTWPSSRAPEVPSRDSRG